MSWPTMDAHFPVLRSCFARQLATMRCKGRETRPWRCTETHGRRNTRVWAQQASAQDRNETNARPRAVVIGAGWAGFGAARALARAGAQVDLLDAGSAPGGVSAGWRTKEGRPVEAGMKGFWTQYPNIDALAKEIGSFEKLTECTRSTFYAYVIERNESRRKGKATAKPSPRRPDRTNRSTELRTAPC